MDEGQARIIMPRKTSIKKGIAKAPAKKAPRVKTQRPPEQIMPGRYTQLGYQSAKIIRGRGTPVATGGSQDYQQRYDRCTIVRESQRLYRENGIYAGTILRATEHILGSGFVLQARTGDDFLDLALETLWFEWQQAPEIRGLHSWYALEKAVLRNVLIDGDCGLIKLKDGKLQLIESEQIDGSFIRSRPKDAVIEQGVELDPYGTPLAYWITDYDRTSGAAAITNPRRVGAADFIFLGNLERISQTRGMPANTCNLAQIHRLQDILDAEAVAVQIQARQALIINREQAQEQAFLTSLDDPDKDLDNQIPPRFEEYEAGTIYHGLPGEEVRPVDRTIPGRFFPATVDTFLRLLGIPLGLPLPLLSLDFSKVNYSSSRAAINQAYVSFQHWQRLMKDHFHSQVYLWQVDRWIKDGIIPNVPEARYHDFLAPKYFWLDGDKEARAWGVRMERGLATLGQAAASAGLDREELLAQRSREIQDAIEKANELNAAYPTANVDWRSLCGLNPLNAPGSAAPIDIPQPEEPLPQEPLPIEDIIQQ